MFAVLKGLRKSPAALLAIFATLVLAACQPTGGSGPRINAGDPVPVALLVPSGSGSAGDELLARSLENAARMAISDLGGVRIDLRVYSDAGQPGAAAAAASRAVDDGARIILGPVYAQAANAAGQAVAGRGISVLSFSNNTDIAGGNVFVLGQTFQSTANRLVRHAASTGKRKIMVVHDANQAGEIGKNAIVRAIQSSGASLAGVGSYQFSQQGVVDAVPGIASTIRSSSADAVFFTADSSGALPLITQLLADNSISPSVYKFIGLTRWDIPAATLALPGIQGGWFALPDPGLSAQFQGRYAATFGEPPHPIAGLAYDGIAAIGALVKSGNPAGLGGAALTQGSGFVGVNGVFRLRADGTNERGLAIAEIRNNQVVLIDPAPRSFGGAGF
ncbi:MAG: penicillin-binding protein activator [Paracoccaceae bacterium]